MIRGVVFSTFFAPHKGGLEQYVFELYRRLTSVVETQIVTCNTEKAPPHEILNGLRVWRLDCWNLLGGTFPVPKLNRRFFSVMAKLWKTDCHFVNAHTRFFPLTLIGFIFARCRRRRFILTEHGTQHAKLSSWFAEQVNRVYDHGPGFVVTRFADEVVAISRASGEFSRHLGARSYTIITNSVDTNRFRPPQLRPHQNQLTVIFVGRLIEAKGVQDLVAVIRQLTGHPGIICQLIGSGYYEAELRRLAHGDTRFHFLGEQDESAIPTLLSQADIFVNPSYSEGLPTSVLEAGAAGCCVIATDVGGTREIIESGVSGYLIAPGDQTALKQHIIELMNDVRHRERLGQELRRVVFSRFNWAVTSSAFTDFLVQRVAKRLLEVS